MKKPAGSRGSVEMPISGHLQELRSRLIRALLIISVFFGISFYFSDTLLAILKHPLHAELIFLSPAEAFWADLKVALFIGFLAALPVILYEVWQFVAPGLLQNERTSLLPFIILSTLFFFIGMAFCYFIAMPFALDFLIDYGVKSGIKPQISISMYIDFNLKFLLGFGLVFELPLVMLFLARMGLLTASLLTKNRKYAVLLAFLIAAILTPTPDVFNQCVMAIPLLLLYEIGIIAIRIFGKAPAPVQKQEPEETAL